MIGSIVGFRKDPTTSALAGLVGSIQSRGGVNRVKSLVDLKGLGTQWYQQDRCRGGIDVVGAVVELTRLGKWRR